MARENGATGQKVLAICSDFVSAFQKSNSFTMFHRFHEIKFIRLAIAQHIVKLRFEISKYQIATHWKIHCATACMDNEAGNTLEYIQCFSEKLL